MQESPSVLAHHAPVAVHRTPLPNAALVVITAGALIYYATALDWTSYEVVRCLLGMACLWGPVAALSNFVLRKAVRNTAVRLAMSYALSYVFTTLLYFAAVTVHLPSLFALGLISATIAAGWLSYRTWKEGTGRLPRPNVTLVAIVASSLATIVPYSTAFTLQPSGSRVLKAYPDQLYHTGLEYELSRHVPPMQASIRGGTPERAYHMFPHLTAVLISRFTGQADMLRAHIVYHYAAITVLICGALYGIGFLLTGDRLAGYTCAFLPFLFAIATPPIIPNSLNYFFFTALPHATSSVFPTLFTSPQMFSGVAVTYGVMLMIAAILRTSQDKRNGGGLLSLLCAPMVAALLRFRVHCWIAVLPCFVLLVSVAWYRTKRMVWLISGGIAMLASVLLYVEMRLPNYLRGTVDLHFGLNQLSSLDYYHAWPFSDRMSQLIHRFLSGTTLDWTWQVVCVTCFSLYNIVGIPLLAAVLFALAKWKRNALAGFSVLTLGMMLLSLLFAMFLNAGYDSYSLAGQMPYHLGWYALPVGGVSGWWVISKIRLRANYAHVLSAVLLVGCFFASVLTQRKALPALNEPKGTITASGWAALQYVKASTPIGAIILSSSPWDRDAYVISGLGARAGYLESVPRTNSLEAQAVRLNPSDNRYERLGAMALSRNPTELCSILRATPITYILEESSFRLMPNLSCLTRVWTAKDGVTAVWKLVHSAPSALMVNRK